jgi:molybdopterin-guanine dinucleotide biosynthesis protein B
MKKVLSIVGTSHRGKTTLLTALIPLLKERGYSVCVIKHSASSLTFTDFDHRGKDTYSFSQAGAHEVWLTSPHFTYHICGQERSLADMIERSSADIVLVEGFKQSPYEKILLKKPDEEVNVKGNILLTIEGSYNIEEILELIIHS